MGQYERMSAAHAGEHDRTRGKRLLRGVRTRGAALRFAVDLASPDGLDKISFGQLAAETGLSKSGVQSLFWSKEVLQLAVIGYRGLDGLPGGDAEQVLP
jgi:hypothetical protein